MKAKIISDRVEVNKELEPQKKEGLNNGAIEPEIELKSMKAIHNTDDNTIEIVLKTGEELTIREPRGKDFLEAEGWISQADESRRSISFLVLKLTLICATFRKNGKLIPKPKMEDFLDLLDDYESMEKVGKAMGFFREPLEGYLRRLQAKANELDMALSGSAVHTEPSP
jgi:hypothetical protein